MDYDKVSGQYGRLFLWTTWYFYTPAQMLFRSKLKQRLEASAGPFIPVPVELAAPAPLITTARA